MADQITARSRCRHRHRRPPATSGTASANSTRRCRAGGCGCSTPPSSGRSAIGSSIRPGRWSRPTRRACSAGSRARRSSPISPRSRRSAGRWSARLAAASLQEIVADPQLLAFARAQGRPAFADNCAPCHGAGGGGAKGYPNLNDDDWLWGGKLEDIAQTIRHGVRSGRRTDPAGAGDAGVRPRRHPQARRHRERSPTTCARSPACRPSRRPILRAGKKIFADNCAVCHGEDGKGNRELGAPNLTDAIWLYGPDKAAIVDGHLERARRRDAGLGRPARRRDHQGARRLRPHAGRRREVSHVPGLRHRG